MVNLEILSKEEIGEKLGAESFWKSKKVLTCLTYQSGISGFDGLSKPIITPKILVVLHPLGMEIQYIVGFKTIRTAIPFEQISSIFLQNLDQIQEQKDKSVIGRAIIGGLLLGPLGAIVGGMSGIGSKEVKAKMPDLILSVVLAEQSEENIVLFSCKFADRTEVELFFTKNFRDKYHFS